MASANVTYAPAGRVDRAGKAAAAKAKRQKLLLAGMGGLFVLLLVIQVPRTLGMLSPAEEVAPPAVAVPVPAAPAVPAPAPTMSPELKAQLERIEAQYAAKDPFVNRTDGVPTSGVGVRAAPAGTRDPFVARSIGTTPATPAVRTGEVRDPFSPPATAASPAEPAPAPTPAPTDAGLRGYTIVLASISVEAGRSAAARGAAAARARGVEGVGVLRSSDYATLRPGYFVVYSQLFPTRREAERALAAARGAGYDRAYVRPLGE